MTPTSEPVIPCTGVLQGGTDASGEVISRCIQVVTGGYKEMYDVNYMETFCQQQKCHPYKSSSPWPLSLTGKSIRLM
jgi:hypothetical protein